MVRGSGSGCAAVQPKPLAFEGINATPKRISKQRRAPAVDRQPWDAPGLPRAERVIRFVNSLPCTQGPLAGATPKLRPWQTKFIKAVYRCDKAGNRLVRTAVLSVSRKNGKTQLAAALCLCALSGPEANSEANVIRSPAQRTRPAGSSTRWWRSLRARRG